MSSESSRHGDRPPRSVATLATLVVGAIVANINLSIANVAIPDIGRELGASQMQQTMVASTFTMGLAASVLYFGAIGDRFGRKRLLLAGAALSVPASLVAGFAPNIQVLIGARLVGGVAAGLLFPTTLSLIAALWRGRARTRAISIWSGVGGTAAAIGGLVGGLLLAQFWWGSVFVMTAPLAVFVLVAGMVLLPRNAGEEDVPIDHFGGVLSVLAIVLLIVTIQRMPAGFNPAMGVQLVLAIALLVVFAWWQRRARRPLVDPKLASAPTFWVAAVAGTIAFGALIGALFLGQQFTQNVLGYSALSAATVMLPSPVMMLVASVAAGRLVGRVGSRLTLASGIGIAALGLLSMMWLWTPTAGPIPILLSYTLVGTGAGLAATASSTSLMASLPVVRAGMGSAFTDLTRDFGGAIMQAVMGTVLAVVYAKDLRTVFDHLPPSEADQLSDQTAQQIVNSFQGAQQVAEGFPQPEASELIRVAADAFTDGKGLAYLLGLLLMVLALGLVLWKYPRKQAEQSFFAQVVERDRRIVATVRPDTLTG